MNLTKRRSGFIDDILFSMEYPWLSTLTFGSVYDPERYDLVPKKTYIDEMIKRLDSNIAYHEKKVGELRKEKDELVRQKQE
jgi:hypothetical protein